MNDGTAEAQIAWHAYDVCCLRYTVSRHFINWVSL